MKMLFTLFCSVLIIGTQAQKTTLVTLSGTIENPASENVLLLDANRKEVKSFPLDAKNVFSGTAEIETGFYNFSHGKESTKIYLVAGDQLNISLNTAQFDESVKYTGTHAKENNYLAQSYLLDENLGQLTYYGYYAKLDEAAFLKLTDSVFTLKNDFLKKAGKLDDEFAYLAAKELEFDKLNQLADYEFMHRYLTKDDAFSVSKTYPDVYKNINFTDENQLKIQGYFQFCESYFSNVLSKQPEQKEDFYVRYLKLIDAEVDNKKIKEELLFTTASHYMSETKNLTEFYTVFTKLSTNEAHKAEITTKYDQLKKIERGQMSPAFSFKTMDDKQVSLADLKGKIVYIDVWATWCQPCLGEIPSLKKLEEEMHDKNIAFVSICAFDTEERWRRMVTDKKLGGTQLYCENKDDNFLTSYFIDGIPRFILLDTEGKIIDANADRPSNPELKTQLESLLAK